MKIAYLTGIFPRPTDTWIQREISALRDQGVDVSTYSVRKPPEDQIVSDRQRTHFEKTTYLLALAKSSKLFTSHLKLLTRSPKNYFKTLKLAAKTKRAGVKGSIYQIIYFIEAGVLADDLKKNKIEHLHNHFADASCTVAMLAASLRNIPFSFTLHGPGIFFEAKTWRIDEKIKRAAFVSCISYFCRSQAAIFTDPADFEKLQIVHCGVEPSLLTQVMPRETANKLLFVARLEEVKGLTHLFEALAELRSKHPEVHLTIVGDGPKREQFEQLATKLNVKEHIAFTGYLSQEDVAKQLAETDILVLPSYAEGVPVTLMEALGSGIPVVATQVGGVSELVEDGRNGFIVRPGDAQGLKDRIDQLLDSVELRTSFGAAGKEKVHQEFNCTTEAAKLKRLFTL